MFMVHDKFLDVFVEVLRTTYRNPHYRRIKVRWWNSGFDGSQPWRIPSPIQTIKVLNKDWKHWRYYYPGQDIHPGRA